jgi:hypothetical protein
MGSSKQTSSRDPYAPSQPLFQQSAGIISDYLKSPNSTSVYGGQRVADQSANTQQGIADLANNKGYGQSRDYMSSVLNGDYLKAGNPYVGQVQHQVESAVMPGINSTFAKSGMIGSTLHQGSLAEGLSNGMAQPLFANYQNERGIQNGAATALPQMDAAAAQAKIAAGGMTDAYQQAQLDAARAKWQEQQDAPLLALNKTYGITSNMGGQGGTQTQTTQANPWQTAAGVGMAGVGLASGMGMFNRQPTSETNPSSYNMPNPNVGMFGRMMPHWWNG